MCESDYWCYKNEKCKKLSKYQNHVIASMSKMAWLMRPPSKSSRLNLDSVKRIGPQKNDLMRGLKMLTERMCVIKKHPQDVFDKKYSDEVFFLKLLTRHMWSPPAPTYRCCSRWAQSSPPWETIKPYKNKKKTRQSKQCGFSIYTFDNLKSKSMSGLVFARKIARVILIQNI